MRYGKLKNVSKTIVNHCSYCHDLPHITLTLSVMPGLTLPCMASRLDAQESAAALYASSIHFDAQMEKSSINYKNFHYIFPICVNNNIMARDKVLKRLVKQAISE